MVEIYIGILVSMFTYLLTYLLTPWSRVLLEKLASFLQLVKKFPVGVYVYIILMV